MPPVPDETDPPVFTIGTVARELGIAANTLRSWEDRYAVVVPARDASGRRRYTRRQLAQLKWLKQQIDQGLQPSEAHRMLEDRPGEERIVPLIPPTPGADPAYTAFTEWANRHRDWLGEVLAGLREAIGAISAFIEVNVPHPEFGLASSLLVRATTEERHSNDSLARFVGVAWTELPEAAEALSRGSTHQFLVSELGPNGQDLYRPTDLRSEMNAPVHHGGVWVAAVGVGSQDERRWSVEQQLLLERARDLIAAEFRASEARASFGRLVLEGDGPDDAIRVGDPH